MNNAKNKETICCLMNVHANKRKLVLQRTVKKKKQASLIENSHFLNFSYKTRNSHRKVEKTDLLPVCAKLKVILQTTSHLQFYIPPPILFIRF